MLVSGVQPDERLFPCEMILPGCLVNTRHHTECFDPSGTIIVLTCFIPTPDKRFLSTYPTPGTVLVAPCGVEPAISGAAQAAPSRPFL